MKNGLLIIVLSLCLQGCFFVAGAAAGAAGIAIVYDHRKIEKILTDERIAKIASDRLTRDAQIHDNTHIEVTCFNQVVLLTGEAPNPRIRQMAEHIVRGVPDIKRIYNQINIKPPTSTLTQASDAWITTKIKTQMLATKDLQSSSIKVVTENGIVYLMGIVSREQSEIAVDIARQVHGVQRVIKIFSVF